MTDVELGARGVSGEDLIDDERVILRGQFSAKVINYQVVFTSLVILLSSFFTLFPVLIFMIPCLAYAFKANFHSRELAITEKTLIYKQGWYVCCCMCWGVSSKHVPLEKITDVTYEQGCLERKYDVCTLRIQTAGQSGPDGSSSEIVLNGIIGAHDFRRKIMRAKANALAGYSGGGAVSAIPVQGLGSGKVASQSNDANATLLRIEATVKGIGATLERHVERAASK